MPNSLQSQSSPYLKDASQQPVNWYPWGKEAFEMARELDKPVIVSIGYSSCHWCRQMSRDNYEDSYIASLMNRHFICIKVDREERPDLDLFYMEASRMFNQSAGWPLHAFCLSDGAPFWCGTYFPKEDNGQGIAPWPQVLLRVAEHFREGREELEENGQNALANLEHSNNANLSDPREWNKNSLIKAGHILCEAHDDETGGFTPSPKFPSPMKMDFLFSLKESQVVRTNPNFSKRINFCLQKTLGAMANGGLFDHVNGGFFRYCLDRQWNSPHFEKMLSDNALLVSTYSRSWRNFQNPQDREVVQKTLAWIEREMRCPQGGYASSLSSETHQMEGAHYLWDHQELVQALGSKDAEEMKKIWGPFAKNPADLYFPKFSKESKLAKAKQSEVLHKLLIARIDSDKPERDEKKSCSLHALLVRAFIDAGLALGDISLLSRAEKLLEWMESTFLLPDGSITSILYPDQSNSSFGFLEDYTFWTEAILSFSAISEAFNLGKLTDWLEKAETLMHKAVGLFKDPYLPGYFSSAEEMENAGPIRKKSWYDHAMPSGNSSLLRCLSILGEMGRDSAKWRSEYQEALGAYPKLIKQSPDGIGHALCATTEQTVGIVQINGPIDLIKKVAEKMPGLSHRPIYLTQQKEISVRINQKQVEIKVSNHQELIEKLWM